MARPSSAGRSLKVQVDRYLVEKAKAGSRRPTPYAARLAAATLKSFATWLAEEGIWAAPDGSSVLRTLRTPKVPKRGRPPFDDGELATIVKVAGSGPNAARDRAIITTMAGCGGLRLKEAWALRLGDIDWRTKELTMRWSSAKGRESRVARLDEIAARALDAYIRDYRPDADDERIFLTAAGKPFTYNGFANHLYRLFDKLRQEGVADGKPHRLRHTWATNGHRMGMTVFDLQREGGWRDLEMVRRYVAPLRELKRMPTPLAGVLHGASYAQRSVSPTRNQLGSARIS